MEPPANGSTKHGRNCNGEVRQEAGIRNINQTQPKGVTDWLLFLGNNLNVELIKWFSPGQTQQRDSFSVRWALNN